MEEPVTVKTAFVDTTAVKLGIHHPVDWVLLRDGARTYPGGQPIGERACSADTVGLARCAGPQAMADISVNTQYACIYSPCSATALPQLALSKLPLAGEDPQLDAAVNLLGLREIRKGDARQCSRSGPRGDPPANGIFKGLPHGNRPGESGGKRVAGADGADGIDDGRDGFYELILGGSDGSPATEREDDPLRSHGMDAAGGVLEVLAGDERAVEQALSFGLIGGDGGRTGFEAVEQSVAIGIEERIDVLLLGLADDTGVEVGGHTRGQAAADHQPLGAQEVFGNSLFNLGKFAGLDVRSAFVELYGEALLVDDGEIAANIVLDLHVLDRERLVLEEFFEALAVLAARGGDGFRAGAEGLEHHGGVDAAPAGRLVGGENIGAVFEDQAVGLDVLVDGRIQSKGQDQTPILRC